MADPPTTPSTAGHAIATRAATAMVRECAAAGLTAEDAAIACESAIAIVVAYAARVIGTPDPARYAQEIIDVMTERAHLRVREVLRG
jgi:hypothetical protein